MAKRDNPPAMPNVPAMPPPPDARIIPLERQTPLTHAQVEQVRFGLGDTGPLAQAVMNANVPGLTRQLFQTGVACISNRRPADPVVGQMIYETDTQQIKFWNGTLWITPANSTPSGSLNPFAGSTAPTGWLLCDGASLLRADYPALFAVIGTTYNPAAPASSFNIPDMQGNIPVGVKSTQTSNPDISALAKTAGTYTKTLNIADLPSHDHTMTHTHGTAGVANGSLVSADHLHDTVGNQFGGGFKAVNTATLGGSGALLAQTGSTSAVRNTGYVTGAADRTLTVSGVTAGSNSANTGSTGGATAVSLVQPSLALNYIIKT